MAMRILFMGTPELAVPSLRAVHGAGHEVVLVVTRPDARRGRGQRVSVPPVKRAALELGLELYQPPSVNLRESVEQLRAARPDVGVVVAYGEILRPGVIGVASRGFINVHASLLPKYRGAAPVNWALIRGEAQTGVTVQRMVAELDAGPILAQRSIAIGPEDTAGDLHDRLALAGADLLVEVLAKLEGHGHLAERPQDVSAVTHAPKLTRADSRIDWRWTAIEVHNRVRGLTPWPGAVTRFVSPARGEHVVLLRVAMAADAGQSAAPGTILRADDQGGIVVQCGCGAVIIKHLKPASGRAMSGADFAHGRHVRPGDRFE